MKQSCAPDFRNAPRTKVGRHWRHVCLEPISRLEVRRSGTSATCHFLAVLNDVSAFRGLLDRLYVRLSAAQQALGKPSDDLSGGHEPSLIVRSI
jgi:hypothetical protein